MAGSGEASRKAAGAVASIQETSLVDASAKIRNCEGFSMTFPRGTGAIGNETARETQLLIGNLGQSTHFPDMLL
jgi:hypothetical protein